MRTVGDLLAHATLVVAALMLFTFASVVASQACPNGTDSAAPARQVAQSAPQIATVLKRAALATSVFKLTIKSTGCCGNGVGHCPGLACAGSCCPACSAGLIIAGWSATRNVVSHVDVPPLQTPMSSPESDPQFRPPRIVL